MRRRIILAAAVAALSFSAVFAQAPPDQKAPPALPAYGQQPAPGQTAPAPTPAPPPAVVPATPTSNAPYVAMPAYVPYGIPDEDRKPDNEGSVYIPVDSWIYPEILRLYSLGYVDTLYINMRPWTRKSLLHALLESEDNIAHSDSEEAQEIYAKVMRELKLENTEGGLKQRGLIYGAESEYGRIMPITGQILKDSYHLGQTITNDYGRPVEPGFNAIAGASTIEEFGRFSLFVRGEYQHAPSGTGYSTGLASTLSFIDNVPYSGYNLVQPTIPSPIISAQNPFALQEATLSVHLAGHEISGGKSDAWLGPSMGGSTAWSNNAQDIYSFRINRVEPLHIPLLSWLIGPVRYDFFYGSLKGHTDPNDDYVHSEMFSFQPTKNVEIGFQRTIIFGGEGHEPVNLHNFLYGFFDPGDSDAQQKFSRTDPGARFSAFTASWRLPFLRHYVTFYVDAMSHDDVSPVSAPRRAGYRTGLYLSQIPGARKLDFRVEGVSSDPDVTRSVNGSFYYYETIQAQGYTNKGVIMGDWIGREAKGGQAWLTYHFSGNEWAQVEYLNKKTPTNFIPEGTTQNQFKASIVKRFDHNNIELNGWFQYERWKAPIYLPGLQTDTTTAIQVTFFPGLKSRTLN